MLTTKTDILALLHQHQDTLKQYGVKQCGLFGSFSRGEATDESDIDLLIESHPEQKTFLNFSHLGFFLEDLLGREIELVTLESLSPYLRPNILNEVEYVTFSS